MDFDYQLSLTRQLKRRCLALGYAARILGKWLLLRLRLQRRMGKADCQQAFPQLNPKFVLGVCQAIWNDSGRPGQETRLAQQQQRYQRIWSKIRSLPAREEQVVRTPAGLRLQVAALNRCIDLILGHESTMPAQIQHAAGGESLQSSLMQWLENAGADAGLATETSLRTALATMVAAPPQSRTNAIDAERWRDAVRTHASAYVRARVKLNRELVKTAASLAEEQLWNQYQTCQVALFAVPQAYDSALAEQRSSRSRQPVAK